jgi:hypothetical protein
LALFRIVSVCLRWGLRAMRGGAAACLAFAMLLAVVAPPARAEGVELTHLALQKLDPGLTLDFNVRVTLPRVVEDALQRGVPLYFVAEATLYRHRWYWRDPRVARASRSWRLSYQPLSDNWRVSLGGLAQSYPTLADAITALSSAARWKIADNSQLEPDERYYVEFSYKLDTSQLPRPMQFGIGGQGDWSLGVERTVRVE